MDGESGTQPCCEHEGILDVCHPQTPAQQSDERQK